MSRVTFFDHLKKTKTTFGLQLRQSYGEKYRAYSVDYDLLRSLVKRSTTSEQTEQLREKVEHALNRSYRKVVNRVKSRLDFLEEQVRMIVAQHTTCAGSSDIFRFETTEANAFLRSYSSLHKQLSELLQYWNASKLALRDISLRKKWTRLTLAQSYKFTDQEKVTLRMIPAQKSMSTNDDLAIKTNIGEDEEPLEDDEIEKYLQSSQVKFRVNELKKRVVKQFKKIEPGFTDEMVDSVMEMYVRGQVYGVRSLFFKCGFVLMLLVYTILNIANIYGELADEFSDVYLSASFLMMQATAAIILCYWYLALLMMIWKSKRVNFMYIYELSYNNIWSSRAVVNAACTVSLVYLLMLEGNYLDLLIIIQTSTILTYC